MALVLPGEFVDARDLAEPRENVGGGDLGDQYDDEIPNDFSPAPNLAGGHRAQDSGHPSEGLDQRAGLLSSVMRQAEGAGLPEERDALLDVVGGLLAEAGQCGEAAIGCGSFEFREGVDSECLVNLPDLGDAES